MLTFIRKFFGIFFFLLGAACLGLTFYLWFGQGPSEMKKRLHYQRSLSKHEKTTPVPLIGNIAGRKTISLNGTWQAIIAPGSSPITSSFGLIERNVRPKSPSDLIEFSFENGLTLRVPGDWNTQDERLFFYRGKVWYKRNFDYSQAAGKRTFLYFGAANYVAKVFVNGKLAGEHKGGFTPFNFEITDLVKNGENLLVVSVDNENGPTDIPTSSTDWLSYGGITRQVRLIELPLTFIENYKIQLANNSKNTISGFVQLDGKKKRQKITVLIPEIGVHQNFRTGNNGFTPIEIKAQPQLWSPDSPKLYSVQIRSQTDAVKDKIGFREISVRGTEILLNNKPIFLRGISIHEEKPRGGGRAYSRTQADTLLGWAKELGCNYVRLAHYPHNENMVRAADSLGLLAWAEIPVYWSVAFGDSGTLKLAEQQYAEMIARDQNRASIILWSLGNETPNTTARNKFFQNLADFVRAKDSTRLLTAALLFGKEELMPFMKKYYFPALAGLSHGNDNWLVSFDDPLSKIVDVVATNEYFGWYYAGFVSMTMPISSHRARQVMLDNMHRIRFQTKKPLLISELGAGAKYGKHAEEKELAVFSEEYQSLVYRKQLDMLNRQNNVRGLSPWILKDFRSPIRLYQGVQDYWNRKGLISNQGEKKQAFYVLRNYYQLKSTQKN